MTGGEWKHCLAGWQATGNFAILLPEVEALRNVPQPPEFHPEGDALVHTLQAVEQVDDAADARVFWAVLLHDIGKKSTTRFFNGRWRAHGHADVGATQVRGVMARFSLEEFTDDVTWMVKHHHYHHFWNLKPGQPLSPRQLKFTRHPLFPLLLQVCSADAAGRIPVVTSNSC